MAEGRWINSAQGIVSSGSDVQLALTGRSDSNADQGLIQLVRANLPNFRHRMSTIQGRSGSAVFISFASLKWTLGWDFNRGGQDSHDDTTAQLILQQANGTIVPGAQLG